MPQIANGVFYTGFISFFDFSGGGLPPFDPSNCAPSGPPWGIKGVLLLYLKTNTSLLHAEDLTRPRPQGHVDERERERDNVLL